MGNDSAAVGRPSPPPTSLAPGFRFHPTDEELVQYYLKRKAYGKPFHIQAVTEIDVYKSEPWELSGNASLKTRDLEWYFFSPVDRKYCNGSRLNRATGKGYWKATGKDRQVRHKDQLIGMKKTLVFHGGRAPDGKRTNWVMHEYRLTDEESERTGVPREKDAFVLCRIFEKSRLGPPNGDRYAPFIEEEWDNGALMVIPGQEAGDEMINGDDAQVEGNELEQETHSVGNPHRSIIEISNIPQDVSFVCKRERSDTPPRADPEPLQNKRSKHDDPNTSRSDDYQLAEPEPLSLAHNYPPKHTDPNCSNTNGSEDSTTTPTAEDLCISTMTAAAAAAANKLPTALLEFPLMESLEPSRGNTSSNSPTFDATDLEKSVPPGYLKYISDLENGILNVSMERETLKIEVMRAQAMINILQSQIDLLHKENQDLRRASRDV